MDRFIEGKHKGLQVIALYLKSNMDRFIDHLKHTNNALCDHLKSNMDRFIVTSVPL